MTQFDNKSAEMKEPEAPRNVDIAYEPKRIGRPDTSLNIKSEVAKTMEALPNYKEVAPAVAATGKPVVKQSAIRMAFKRGFCRELAERGIDPDTFDTMFKSAGAEATFGNLLGSMGKGLGTAALGATQIAGGLGKGMMIGIPATAALGGWALGSRESVTSEDMKNLERLATLHEYENAIKRMRGMDHKEKAKQRPPAGQTTQSVVEDQMPKAAAAATVPSSPMKPDVSVRTNVPKPNPVAPVQPTPAGQVQGNVKNKIETARARVQGRLPALK